jgi:competence protein ComEC
MGDDAQIAVADWQLFLSTGTTHLMSISYLLKH